MNEYSQPIAGEESWWPLFGEQIHEKNSRLIRKYMAITKVLDAQKGWGNGRE